MWPPFAPPSGPGTADEPRNQRERKSSDVPPTTMLALLTASTALTLDNKHAAAPALRLRGGPQMASSNHPSNLHSSSVCACPMPPPVVRTIHNKKRRALRTFRGAES